MLQVNQIRADFDQACIGLKKRNLENPEDLLRQVLLLDDQRKKIQMDRDNFQAESNNMAREIGQLMRTGKKDEAEKIKEKTASLKSKVKLLEEEYNEVENTLTQLLYTIPNIPHHSVKPGNSAEDNEEVLQHGSLPVLDHKHKLPHWDLIKKYDIVDFELGAKITGAGFPVYKGKGAKLQRGLINFFLEEAEKAGYEEVQPPILINEESGYATGQLPDKEGQMYLAAEDGLYLIPTAEVPITNMYRNELLSAAELPKKNVGYTPCFRREAGSWGAHVRGLNRLHQFDKVEIVQITHPEHSYQTLDTMSLHVQGLLQKLGLPFRVLRLCGGDMGFTAALTYDLEVFSAAQERWLEVSSVSNFETYQSNRLKLRFKNESKKTLLAHTLNGSALALPRIIAALLENNQSEKGIRMPEVLLPYLGFEWIS
ncbi:seryl-tRNA synthetase [Cyclobacterium lianum]|uniref:Serine--tRNA ligase n=1 Tax=Cyclobacterium lianum TaxID=388280 RepID=A0A1M7JMD5_9BACT|nr:serine--tRNA ligase [Cyclobacterium lianum]SHM53903.1 seryl-tRNA synthetase [Cyclobacterium lianum]